MKSKWMLALGAWVASSACLAPPVETPQPTVTQTTPIQAPQNINGVDILFMVDNSLSMDAMQAELRARFGDFLQVFQDLATRPKPVYADLHIGVVTSDYGAGYRPDDKCDASPGGQRGLLQAIGQFAPPGCMPPTDTPFIRYKFGPDGTNNLPAGQDLLQTFTCMASVGSNGCGFEHQLESVYAALHNTVENAGFVRDDATLAIIFITNEDDGSAPPSTDIFDRFKTEYGYYDTYRQTRFGVACGDPLALAPYGPSMGPLTGCVPAENDNLVQLGREYDVSRYIDYFTKPGLKDDPDQKLILVAIDGPEAPFETALVQGGSGNGQGSEPFYVPCDTLNPPGCLVRLKHSCQNAVKPVFFADPSVRLNAVIRSAKLNTLANICGNDPNSTPSYAAAMTEIANKIKGTLLGCIPAALPDPANPQCVVQDYTKIGPGQTQITELPRCDLVNDAPPCWRVETNDDCSEVSPQHVGVTVVRSQPTPSNTTLHVECSTVAH